MKSKTLVVLIALVVVVVAASLFLNRETTSDEAAGRGAHFVPGLQQALNDIEGIKLTVAGDDGQINLTKTDSGWVVEQKFGFAANSGRIRKLLIGLGEAKVVEKKTSNPAFYERLGVEDVGPDGGSGVMVEIEGLDQPLQLIIGDVETRGGDGTYVRRVGAAASYLVDRELAADRSATNWLDRSLVDIPSASVTDIRIEKPGADSLHLTRVGQWMVVWGLPEGREMASPTVAESMGSLVTALRLEELVPEDQFDGGEPDAVGVYQIEDGRVVEVTGWRNDEGSFVSLNLSMAPEQEGDDQETAKEQGEDGEAVEADEPPPVRADPADVALANQRLSGWVFQISPPKFDFLVKDLEEMLKPLPDEES